MAYLEVIRGPQRGQRFPLLAGRSTIGRDESCEIPLLDETASRQHVRIELDGEARLEDLGSANGTLLNGQRIPAASSAVLGDGDQIHLGQTVLRFSSAAQRDTVILGDERNLSEVIRIDPVTRPGQQRPGEAESHYFNRLQSLCRVVDEVAGRAGVEELLQAAATALAREMPFERGAIEILGGRTIAFDGAGGLLGRQFKLSRGLTASVRKASQATLFSSDQDPELADRRSIVSAGTTSAICVPLVFRDELIGLIYLDRTGQTPFEPNDLRLVRDLAGQISPALGREVSLGATQLPDALIAVDACGLRLLETIDKAAPTSASVLLLGETGVGKELYARRLHQLSDRASGPFVPLNMAALPETLVESELFGHEAGAFTGADRSSPGKFRLAHGGTLFLDEIGELAAEIQAKLLRALESQTFYPVGASEPVTVDVRIVAATNLDLSQSVADGRFRQDLYYRLAVVEIPIPALRERPADIPALTSHFFSTMARRLGRAQPRWDRSFDDALARHAWPGNVRELRNLIERVLVLCGSGVVSAADLPTGFGRELGGAVAELPLMSLKEAERWAIIRALEYTGGKKGETVKLLGTSWPTLNKKIKDYGIDLAAIKEGETR